jgi:hypothetical protein
LQQFIWVFPVTVAIFSLYLYLTGFCTGFLVGKPEGKRPLEKPRRRWEDGIKTDLREIGWGVWSGFTWFRIGTGGGLL